MIPALVQDAFVAGLLVVLFLLLRSLDAHSARIADVHVQLYSALDRIAKADSLEQLRAEVRTGWPELFDAERGKP